MTNRETREQKPMITRNTFSDSGIHTTQVRGLEIDTEGDKKTFTKQRNISKNVGSERAIKRAEDERRNIERESEDALEK